MESVTQLSLPLFDTPTFDELLQQHRSGKGLSVQVSGRLKRRWLVRSSPFPGRRQLVIPHFLYNAPREIKSSLIEWALLPYRPKRSHRTLVRKKRAELEKKIWGYVETLPEALNRRSRFDPLKPVGCVVGTVYDLREVFDSVNKAWFNGSLRSLVRWGKGYSKTSYHVTKIDAAGVHTHLITIAGAYNHPKVPRFAIEAIMYHEMLHIAVPPYRQDGRAVIHGREFQKREKAFTWFQEWRDWERDVLVKLRRQALRRQGL